MRTTFTCVALLSMCLTMLAVALAQEPENRGSKVEQQNQDPLDQLLADFVAASGKLDIEMGEKLFLPPDDTPTGKNRKAHVSELVKDWKRAKESGAKEGPLVQFKNTKKVIRTQMVISGPGGPKQGHQSEVEFVVAYTKDGWKIVSMETVPAQSARGK